ncbi:MAG: cytochrome C oxidase subunit IV family protein [Candidatus Eisenbacteria bacterium]|nr:cytochrome C oxidase subunit IV family protein [Candidatus Eisenbacteria bacterium]
MSAHGTTQAATQGHGAAGHHRNYVKIWAILVVLLVISVVGPMTGIRVVMLITAFGVALVKAYLVAKNFMHLDIEKPIVHWLLGLALMFMVLLYAGVAPDVQKSDGQNWKKDAGYHHLPPQPLEGAEHGGAGGGHGGAHEAAKP